MRLNQIKAELQSRRGTGAWARISRDSGVNYNQLTQIARGDTDPRASTCERIVDAILLEQAREAAVARVDSEAGISKAA